jgi:hypothetical protein
MAPVYIFFFATQADRARFRRAQLPRTDRTPNLTPSHGWTATHVDEAIKFYLSGIVKTQTDTTAIPTR